jgi:hypothetical protein
MSVAMTYIHRPKVAMSIVFCFRGRCIDVKAGIGKTSTAMSVMILTGADARYSLMRGIHLPSDAKASLTGMHWKTLKNVKTKPAILITANVIHDAIRINVWVL